MVLQRRGPTRLVATLGVAAVIAGGLAACSGSGAQQKDSKSINVLMVNNGTETDLSKLTDQYFTPKYGITVHIKLMSENALRSKVQQELANQGGQYDVMSVGSYELPSYSANGWLSSLDDYVKNDTTYDQSDILPAVQKLMSGKDGKIYGEPTETDTGLLMYNKKQFAAAGVSLPDHSTWQQVEDVAAKLKAKNSSVSPICLRGLAGWGQLGATLTSVVNTFGGTWFTKDWKAEVNGAGFTAATQFYVDLLKKYGPAGSATNGVGECFNSFAAGKSTMWYDSSNAGSFLEANGSTMKGNVGYAAAPTAKPDGKAAGYLFTWGLGIEKASPNQKSAATFIKWASSKEFEKLVASKYGWAAAPPGQRTSLYSNPDYLKAGAAFVPSTQYEFQNIDPANPGYQARPTVGVQYVSVPEFAALGDQVTQEIANAIAGKQTVTQALDKGQADAEVVAKKYQK